MPNSGCNMSQIDDSCLGLGPTAFNNMFSTLAAQKKGVYSIKWKGVTQEIPIYMISICHLRYNLFNTRVKPHLKQYISENGHPDNYFQNIDKDKTSTQSLIQNFLTKNPDRKEALKYFRDGNKQVVQEPLVSTLDGRLINGNQRLCCYRELWGNDPGKYDHLQTAYVAFLPDNGTYKDERALEATFQDTKLQGNMFDWIQQGLWLIEQITEGNSSPAKIGQTIGKSEGEIKSQIGQIYLAREFLEYIEAPECWVTLRDEMQLTQAFKTLQEKIATHKSKDDRDILKKVAFKIMSEPDATKGKKTSVHLQIISTSKNIKEIKGRIKPKPKVKKPKPLDTDDILAPIVDPIDDVSPPPNENVIDIDEIDPGELVDIITDVVQVVEDRNKAKNEKHYGKRQLTTIVTSLDNIITNWESIEKKDLAGLVNKAMTNLKTIKDKL